MRSSMFLKGLCAQIALICGPAFVMAGGPVLNVDTNDAGCDDGVGTPYCTIQAAIDDLPAGGEIIVAPGTYNETINFLGRAIHLHSSGGAAVTTIDGGGAGTVVTCAAFEGSDTILEGFTVTGGSNLNAGGMQNSGSLATVTDCVFTGNTATFGFGGGMYNDFGSAPTVTGCTFTGNSGFGGGGMYNDDSDPTVTECKFIGNTASMFGGGGMNNKNGSSPVVTGCLFVGNGAQFGGGMGNEHSTVAVGDCSFSGNTATSTGGGVWNNDSTSTLTGCSIGGNMAVTDGGGIFNTGAVGSSPPVTNCVLWADSPNEIVNDDPGSTPTVAFSDVQGGIGAGSIDGGGNIAANPEFVDLDGVDNTIGTEDDNLRLKNFSPCVDTGDPDYVPSPGEMDLDANDRAMGCRVDMGAFEFVQVPQGPPNSGDMDASGGVNYPDVAPFVQAVLAGIDLCETADMNDDGSVDGGDIQLFVEAVYLACVENNCALGENCQAGECTPTAEPDIEIGIGGGAFCLDYPYMKLNEGDVLSVCQGPQGFFDSYLAFRAKGFTPGGVVSVKRSIKMVGTSCPVPQDCDPGFICVDGLCSPTSEYSSFLQLSDDPDMDGVIEGYDFHTIIFSNVDGQEVIISVTMTDQTDPQITASLDVTAVVFVKYICSGETCDPGQTCVNGFCEPE